jgi:hypothetical protein
MVVDAGLGTLPHWETHQLCVQPGHGAMVMSQDGYPQGDYSIAEALVPVMHP